MRYLFICFLLLINNLCFGQLSFAVEGGYQFKMGSSKLSDGIVMVDQSGNQGLEIVRYSFGEGYHFAGNAMVNLNEDWEVGLKVSYLLGKNILGYVDTEFQSKMLRFIPQIKYKLGGDRLSAFTTIGFIIGTGGFVEEFESTDETGLRTNRTFEYSEGISYGINNSVGVEYETDTQFNFFLKLDTYLQSYGPKRRQFTTYTIGDVDILPSLNTSDKEIEYADFVPNGVPTDPDLPVQRLRRIYPFSSFGISLGILMRIGD